MRIKEGQIFNLMDTNGRRNDVINALQGYLTILDDIQNEQKMNWASMPESLAQYEFYRQAIELSPEVFGKHGIKLLDWLVENKRFYPIRLHTMNPVGRENMLRMIRRYW